MKTRAQQLKSQARQEKRGSYERKRRRHFLFLKNIEKYKKKEIQFVQIKGKKKFTPVVWLYSGWRALMRQLCKVGFHTWTLHSGLPFTPKYMCFKCSKFSREVWGNRNSSNNKNKNVFSNRK